MKKRIRALRAYTLTEELSLDEARAARVFPVLARFDEELDKLMAARAALHQQLDRPPADPRALDKAIDDTVANQRAAWDLEARRFNELRALLTPAQAARLLVVLPALERRIHNRLRQAMPGGDDRDDDRGGDRRDDRDDDRPRRRGPRPPRP